jgi:hypothetical protein
MWTYDQEGEETTTMPLEDVGRGRGRPRYPRRYFRSRRFGGHRPEESTRRRVAVIAAAMSRELRTVETRSTSRRDLLDVAEAVLVVAAGDVARARVVMEITTTRWGYDCLLILLIWTVNASCSPSCMCDMLITGKGSAEWRR